MPPTNRRLHERVSKEKNSFSDGVFSSRQETAGRKEPEEGKKPHIKRRFFCFFALVTAATFGMLLCYALLMLNPSHEGISIPAKNLAERGPILDRNGRILAIQTRLGNISVWRPEITDLELLSQELAPILDISARDIRNRISSAPSDFIYLKKQVNQSTINKMEAYAGRLQGVSIEPIMGRIYPERNLASQIIGFVGDENNGLEGIEYAFEAELAPEGAQNGKQVMLTIDANVQHILEEIAERTLTENKAEAVMLLAMDPRTGDILGSASAPGFDPNNIRSSTEVARMNRPMIWAYEPGSVFKIFSLSALIDSEAISGDSVFVCNGHYERTTNLGERISINCLSAHGRVTAREIITYSCNAGAAYAADKIGAIAFYELIKNFGFGSRVGVGTSGETAGFFRPVDRWSDRSKPTIAMGQEISVSALQMLQAASAIANDGILIPPRIVSRIRSNDGETEQEYQSGTRRRVLKTATARAMRSYMTDVTSGTGTGWRANMGDLSMAVKTGTAQITDSTTGAYSDTDYIASCMAMLPADAPSLILYLAIVRPQGPSYLGGRIAAPIIRDTAEALVDYLGIPRGRNPQVTHSGSITVPNDTPPAIGDRVPDFSGYAKRQLMPLLLRDDLHIEIHGEGWVTHQSPPPGTPLKPETTIILELE
ncbi:MAG: transpeptidase family protein [Treponema sp.]|jgi:cell division protein FtsI (penicillin-binding protein 3)|nr:transpeptidase family protein [Treponema sp.]